MAKLFCDSCQKESNFLPIHMVQKIAAVSRSTIYYWLDRGWIHWLELPSGRRVICEASLSRRASPPPDLSSDTTPLKRPSKNVQSPGNL